LKDCTDGIGGGCDTEEEPSMPSGSTETEDESAYVAEGMLAEAVDAA